ncbi:MAG: lysoplasmalogenase [Treponema sp.]|nr:lysoplasmalogenase [Treponema sp.]
MRIFFIAFAVVSAAHITFIILRQETFRCITKCFIIPLLLAAYTSAYITSGTEDMFLIPIFALIMGWIGDILLIRKDKKTFLLLGLTSFLIGHIFYIAVFIGILSLPGFYNAENIINIPSLLIFTPVSAGLAMIIFRLIKPTKEMRLPVIFYMIVLMGMSLVGFQVFLFNTGFAGLLILSGCFCFIVSDTILAYYTFRKSRVTGSVLVTSYYIMAQTKIIIGLLLI